MRKGIIKKIAIALVLIITFTFGIPKPVQAGGDLAQIGGTLTREFIQFIIQAGDLVLGALNKFMLRSRILGWNI